MMGNTLRLRLVSADIPARLQGLLELGLRLQAVRREDLLTASFTLAARDLPAVETYARAKGDDLVVISGAGPMQAVRFCMKRPLLTGVLAALFLLTLWLPSRVLFIRVEGATTVAPQRILQCAEAAGIYFGAGVRQVRSERVKNSLLEAIPELSWVGVNTNGCVATLTVAQRDTAEADMADPRISSLVSGRDAQITELTVTQGSALCKPGQVVRKGQVLISGYTDCGLKITAAKAEGEVFGRTRYAKTLLFPCEYREKQEISRIETNFFLRIGKKEIKLRKDSGISHMICDKMYTTHYLRLPGGFTLPLAVTVQRCVYYTPGDLRLPISQAQGRMESLARQYLLSDMISGQILTERFAGREMEGAHQLTGSFQCREMIARIRYEEIAQYDEQNGRKGRKR